MKSRVGTLLPLLAVAIATGSSCSSGGRELTVPAPVYAEAVTAFHTGLAALETSQDGLALEKLQRVTILVPKEPAAWANLGLLYLRHQELDLAAQQLARAAALAPGNAAIARLQGLANSLGGHLDEAVRDWTRAVELDPNDVRSAFAIAQELERQGGEANEAQAEQAFATLLGKTDNLAVRLEYARLAAKHGKTAALREAIAPLAALSATWPPDAREQLQALRAAAAADTRTAALQVVFLKNLLLASPSFRQALALVSTAQDAVGEPLDRFLALANPEPKPAPADTSLAFTIVPGAEADATEATGASAVSLRGEGAPVVAVVGPAGVLVAGRAVRGVVGASGSLLAADLNYDFRTDLVVAGPRGLTILHQGEGGDFTDVTAAARIPGAIRSVPLSGTWSADVDLDGDLDLVVALTDGAPSVLRNNSDGTFTVQMPFTGVTSLRGFVWVDVDDEGTPDAATLDGRGTVRVFRNLRGGVFKEQPLTGGVGKAVAIAAGDVGHGRGLDLVLLGADGAVSRVTPADGTASAVARLSAPPGPFAVGTAHVRLADLDNNGAADLIVSSPTGTQVLLAGADGQFATLPETLAFRVTDAADVDGDGRLDLIGLDGNGRVVRATSHGSKRYHWQVIRPRAAQAFGDQRINAFGMGGEVEIRSGLHTQRQVITSPIVHFGLGEATLTNVVRITWPNGVLQSDFDQKADAVMLADQRLKGSCPWLFAWNGRAMAFVTDLIWRSPLGLRINAQATADVLMTEDRVKVPGSALVARDGAYDLRITAELWETHFFDLASLLVVDHPAGTEAFIDERFAVPPPSLEARATGPVQPFGTVRDDRGRDVSAVVLDRDDRHLDFAGRGDYQGITRDHSVELDLPDQAPRDGPLWLVAQGWIHPTDSSVNVAISQGAHAAPRGLSLAVADATGRFHEVRGNLGFPAGKDKTVLLDLTGLFPRTGARRLRVSTNLEIFWDRLGWAVGRPDVHLDPRRIALSSADLRYRGYSVTGQPAPGSPERPRYELSGTAPRWLDLEGYYTRYGDVRELLARVDDRYVIMNAGDELRLRFPEAAPPAPGMVRDFIVVGDGWVKDGDYNTSFSRTVLPLPTHRQARYDTPPGRLEDDPVYRQHRQDFADYHTRYVVPAPARDALRNAGSQVTH